MDLFFDRTERLDPILGTWLHCAVMSKSRAMVHRRIRYNSVSRPPHQLCVASLESILRTE